MKKTILYIAPRLPEYDRASGDLRFYRILEILSKEFSVVVYNDGAWERFLKRGDTIYQNALESLGIRVLLKEEELIAELQSGNLLGVVCQFYQITNKYKELIHTYATSVPIILDTVDISFFREQMMAVVEDNSSLTAKAEQTRAEELSACHSADYVWVVGTHDYDVLKEYVPEKKLSLVPNIHILNEAIPSRESREQNTILFVGGFLHSPNVDAMLYFCKEILPLVKKEHPAVKLKIVGDSPPETIKALANDTIEVTGYVPSTKPYVDSAMVSIAPLRAGAGLKGKVGEALSEGLPVVTTSIGAQGMHLINGEDCFITDLPQDFATSILRLLKEPQLWKRCSMNGRNFIESAFGYKKIKKDLLQFFKSIENGKQLQQNNLETDAVRASVVFLTKNGGEGFAEALKAVLNQKAPFNYEVIAVDSGSTDGTLELLKQSPVRLYTIPPQEFNFGLTRDYGFSLGKGEVVIAISQDAVPTDSAWLSNLVMPFEDEDIAVVQGNAPLPPGYDSFYWEKIRKFYYTSEAKHWSSTYGIGLSFVCCAIRRSVWEENKLGRVEMSEDKVFQEKIARKKLKIIKNNNAMCYHGHDYNLVSLLKRIENEGLGWRNAGLNYSFFEMMKDFFNVDTWLALASGIIAGEIRSPAELFFPLLRPICVYIGNHFTMNYVK